MRLLLCLLLPISLLAQRPYGHEKAIPADSNIIMGWAISATVQRGYQHCGDTSFGYADVGEVTDVYGKPGTNGVLSLGDGGSVTVQMNGVIKNGNGPDFAVFENSIPFSNGDSIYYIEYAFVEVSSDGAHFLRFPAYYFGDTSTQKDFKQGNKPNVSLNLAGNYATGYGTPFDLEELKDSSGIDLQHITHIRIIDAVGSMQDTFARRDYLGNKINDPWPTAFPSSGFDLDAVAMLNGTTGINELIQTAATFFPNPVKENGVIQFDLNSKAQLSILDALGHECLSTDLSHMQPQVAVHGLTPGIYFIKLNQQDRFSYTTLIIQN